MILQYKGFNNNRCYIEAETISWTKVWVGKEACKKKNDKQDSLSFMNEKHANIEKIIRNESGAQLDEIIYCLRDTTFEELENVTVVALNGQNLSKVYVFSDTVYLLNNSGKTVQKII